MWRERSDRVLWSFRRRLGGRAHALGHLLKIGNEIAVAAVRLALVAVQQFQNFLDAIDCCKNKRHGFAGRRQAIAELAHQRLGGVCQRFKPRQIQKSARALDGVDETKNVAEDFGVVGILFETHKLDVDHVETFVRSR